MELAGSAKVLDPQLEVRSPWNSFFFERKRELDAVLLLGERASRSAAFQAIARKVRLSWRNDIFECRSFSLRGPSTICTRRGMEDRLGIAGAERRERRQLLGDLRW